MSSIKKDLVLAELKKILADFRDKDLNLEAIKNLLVFGNDIEIDLNIKNPTLQYKKKVEDTIAGIMSKNEKGLKIPPVK